MEPAGVDDWAPAAVNRPFTTGDYLYTDDKAVAELQLDSAVMRMGQYTSFGFLNLNDQVAQLKLTEGDMYFRIHDIAPDQSFEVDTPNAAINLLRDGVYRIHVDPNANTTFVSVRDGQAQVTGGGQAFTLSPGNSANLSGTDQLAYDIEGAPEPDAFDNWCAQRDNRESSRESARYVPPTMIGNEDLDDYGTWNQSQDYGEVWYPSSVPVGWSPYHYGHWAWIEPWGWTWVDDAPWGFAPFHYGRWVYWHERWGWAPGPIGVGYGGPVVRPMYAPAMVAWFGGSHFGIGLSIGSGVGWVPLGWGEVYTPSYAVSRGYFEHVNVYNTRVVNQVNITNVYNTVYVNKTVYNQTFVNSRAPNAVVAMRQEDLAGGRPVNRTSVVVNQPTILNNIHQSVVVAPAVAPTRMAVAPSLGRPAARPPAQLMQRQVVARATPPAAPAPFAARQAYLQQHAGQPHNYVAMHQAVAPQVRPVALVRQAPAAQPVAVRPGQRVGNAPAFAARPASQPATQPATQAQPLNRPGTQGQPVNRPGYPSPTTQPQVAHQAPGAQPAAQPAQPPRTHGAPPNLSQGVNQPNARYGDRNTTTQPRYDERTQQPAPARNTPQPAYDQRTQPAPARTAPEPRADERTQPAPARNTPAAPNYEERTQPAPARTTPPPARTEERTQPREREQARPAESKPEHGTPPAREEHKDEKK